MRPNIRLTGHIDVPAYRLEAVQDALPAHIRLSLAEPGCISFSVTPDPEVHGRFLVAEEFSSRATFDAHQVRVQASEWGRTAAGITRKYVVSESAPRLK